MTTNRRRARQGRRAAFLSEGPGAGLQRNLGRTWQVLPRGAQVPGEVRFEVVPPAGDHLEQWRRLRALARIEGRAPGRASGWIVSLKP